MHTNPEAVQSPKASVAQVRVLYDTGAGGWALASMLWEGKPVLGMRWNGDEKNPIGNPQSRGIPTWFVLPDEIAKLAGQHLQDEKLGLAGFPPIHSRVQLRPLPHRIWQGQQQPPVDDIWLVTNLDTARNRMTISNTSTGHVLPLWPAHVHSFIRGIASPGDEFARGILNLSVQVVLEDGQMSLHPLAQV